MPVESPNLDMYRIASDGVLEFEIHLSASKLWVPYAPDTPKEGIASPEMPGMEGLMEVVNQQEGRDITWRFFLFLWAHSSLVSPHRNFAI